MSKSTVFLRDATGLVREIGFIEHLALNANALPLMSVALTPWFVWVGIPGGDPIFATVLAFIFTIPACLSYALVTANFPRAAAPYIAESRVFGPAIAWPVEVLLWLTGGIMSIGSTPSLLLFIAIAPGLYAMGISSGNQVLVSAAWALIDPKWTVVAGTLILGTLAIITMRGTRFLTKWFNLSVTALLYLGVIAIIAVLATSHTGQFVALTNTYLKRDYATIISTAKQSYPDMMGPPSFTPYVILASIGFGIGAVNTYWNAYGGGEVKRGGVVKMQIMSMIIPSIIALLISVVTFSLAYNVVGRDFLQGFTQLMTYNPTFFNAPFFTALMAVTFVPMMLANNPYIQFIIMIGLAAGAIAYFPVLIILLTRDTFAWSFDRLIPAKFAEVNDRWGTPIFNIAFNFALCWIYMVILTYFSSYFVTLFATTWDMGQLGLILVPLSLAFLPLRKSLWETSPLKKYVILAIPVVSIIGILGAVEPAVALWIYSTNPYMGFGLSGLELLIASFVTPFVLYWVIRAIRHRQGLDVTLISRQIPPE